MPRDAAKRMKPELMWAIIDKGGKLLIAPIWGRWVLSNLRAKDPAYYPGSRIVRVRVTQYKPPRKTPPVSKEPFGEFKPRKRHAT